MRSKLHMLLCIIEEQMISCKTSFRNLIRLAKLKLQKRKMHLKDKFPNPNKISKTKIIGKENAPQGQCTPYDMKMGSDHKE